MPSTLQALVKNSKRSRPWALVSGANLYVSQTAPWSLAKAGEDAELDIALASLARCLYRLAVMVSPFMPSKGQELWDGLGQPGSVTEAAWDTLGQPAVGGTHTEKGAALFPKG